MRKSPFLAAVGLALFSSPSALFGQLTDNFEDNDNTELGTWGHAWAGGGAGAPVATFLSNGFGGNFAGGGDSLTQAFERDFRGNTGGVDVEQAYQISMYVQIDSITNPAAAQFHILDGDFGDNNAANLRIFSQDIGGGLFSFHWQARTGSNAWTGLGGGLGLEMIPSTAYHVVFSIDPLTNTYGALVEQVGASGNLLGPTASISGIDYGPNVNTNNANGQLTFYIQASAGTIGARVDNINIIGVPEPNVTLLGSLSLLGLILARRRRRT